MRSRFEVWQPPHTERRGSMWKTGVRQVSLDHAADVEDVDGVLGEFAGLAAGCLEQRKFIRGIPDPGCVGLSIRPPALRS